MPPLFIGLVHGLAGSAAVALLVLAAIPSPVQGVLYLAVFGGGTIAGMMAVTAAIAAPTIVATQRVASMRRYVRVGAGALSLAFGLVLAHDVGVRHQLFGAAPSWIPE
jgi:high-affinity nickel-transport protein